VLYTSEVLIVVFVPTFLAHDIAHKTLEAPIHARQASSAGTSNSSCSCISSGSIAGIVIGSIAGTLLILWLIWTVRATSEIPRATSSVGGRHSHHSSKSWSRRGSYMTYVDADKQGYRVQHPKRVYYKPKWRDLRFDCREKLVWWRPRKGGGGVESLWFFGSVNPHSTVNLSKQFIPPQ
jgi:hypothetical protein